MNNSVSTHLREGDEIKPILHIKGDTTELYNRVSIHIKTGESGCGDLVLFFHDLEIAKQIFEAAETAYEFLKQSAETEKCEKK